MGLGDCMKDYDLVIENAAILTMDADGTIIKNGVIGVKDGVISLLEEQTPDFCCRAEKRIDAQGMLALPGFVNTHVHCFQSLLKAIGSAEAMAVKYGSGSNYG